MAGTFSPFGLRYDRSLSTSNNSTDGFREYELDPSYSGFAGDLATPFIGMASLITGGTTNPDYYGIANETRNTKYIFPMPALMPLQTNTSNGQTPAQFTVQGASPLLGVFASFEYYPVSANGQIFRGNYYIKDTPLVPGTKVIAKVICDPNANYDIQYKTLTQYPQGLPQKSIFTSGFVYNDTGYYKELLFQGVNTGDQVYAYVWFPTGTTENGGGSTSYFVSGNYFQDMQSTATAPSISPINPNSIDQKGWSNNQTALIIGLGRELNNEWADPNAVPAVTAENNIVQVKLLMSYAQLFDDTASN